MATVAAIFDDSVALENAIDKLQRAGLGDDILKIEEEREADVAPEQTVTDNTDGEGVMVPPLIGGMGAGGAGGVGQTQGTPGLFAGIFSGGDNSLDRLGDDAEAFELALARGGKLIVLETREVDKAISTLQAAGAQQLHDPR